MSFKSLSKGEEIRIESLNRRKALSKLEVEAKSKKIVDRLLENVSFKEINFKNLNIGLYCPLSFEVNLKSLEKWLKDSGSRIYFPRIKDRNLKELEFVEVSEHLDEASAWKIGPSYGISEPHPELKATSPDQLELFFVPGVAFGQSGERIGMGAGYYDRYLEKSPSALRIALAFDFQVYPKLDQKPWDQPVHWIITESREIKTPYVRDWIKSRKEV